MISETCPKLTYGNDGDWGETLEAFSLSYLASYANVVLPARVVESYKRAWGFDTIHAFPRVPGSTPNMIALYYRGDGVRKVHVAIEGTTSLFQLWLWNGGSETAATVGALPGKVYGPPAAYATDILAILAADAEWVDALAWPNTMFTFSGFSLGSMIAEILAYKFKAANPAKHVQFFKFGSPRVGTDAWYAGRNPQVRYTNIACERDPIGLVPRDTLSFTANLAIPWQIPVKLPLLRQDPRVNTFDRNGRNIGGYQPNRNGDCSGIYGAWLRARTPTNSWFYHDQDIYRAMLSGIASDNPMLAYRFMWLEHPDENSWGIDYPTYTWQTPPRKRVIVPTPDDLRPDQAGVGDFFAEPFVPQTQIRQRQFQVEGGASAGGDWGGDETSAGGDWYTENEPRTLMQPLPDFSGPSRILPRRLGRRMPSL